MRNSTHDGRQPGLESRTFPPDANSRALFANLKRNNYTTKETEGIAREQAYSRVCETTNTTLAFPLFLALFITLLSKIFKNKTDNRLFLHSFTQIYASAPHLKRSANIGPDLGVNNNLITNAKKKNWDRSDSLSFSFSVALSQAYLSSVFFPHLVGVNSLTNCIVLPSYFFLLAPFAGCFFLIGNHTSSFISIYFVFVSQNCNFDLSCGKKGGALKSGLICFISSILFLFYPKIIWIFHKRVGIVGGTNSCHCQTYLPCEKFKRLIADIEQLSHEMSAIIRLDFS